MEHLRFGRPERGWRRELYNVIFESDTRAGRLFDIVLLVLIVASVAVVMLDSVQSIAARHGRLFNALEWVFTLLFTVEYVARLACVRRPMRYATSFFGVVDLLAVLPTWLAIFFPELHALIDVRVLRMLRVFRILKLTAYVREFRALAGALRASRRRIAVFIVAVGMVVVLLATVMYVVEGAEHGFTSIPVSIYWAVTTLTTVGFGDITPKTDLGRAIASLMMLLGWGILAVPTGIVTAEMTSRQLRTRLVAQRRAPRLAPSTASDDEDDAEEEELERSDNAAAPVALQAAASCSVCGAPVLAARARFCHACGEALPGAPRQD
ncbi:MAG: ion transporter [Burkholderiaceae bacterium]|nr:ion transporter [Burkholderiaceae bacterium]